MSTATKPAKQFHTIAPEPIWVTNILFLTDFSPASNAALPHALSVARRFEAKVYVAHVLEQPFVAPLSAASTFYEAVPLREDAEKRLNALLSEEELKGVLHEVILAKGPLWPAVKEIVAEKNVDLIVMGTHGRKGFRKMMLGSVAEEIYRKANCPVLAIGPENPANPEKEMRPRRILLATDFQDKSHFACDYAVAMALRHAAELVVLHVIEDRQVSDLGRAEQQRLAALARLEGLIPPETPLAFAPEMVVARGEASDEITQAARQHEADLIVVGLHGEEGMVAYLPGTVAYRVICQAPCPVLTVPAATRE